MAMVGVGGSIGTGLLLGSGAAIQIAGPAVIISFLVAALICWTVTVAFGEMASLHPAAGSFGVYAEIYLNSWAGFISRYGLWVALAIAIGSCGILLTGLVAAVAVEALSAVRAGSRRE